MQVWVNRAAVWQYYPVSMRVLYEGVFGGRRLQISDCTALNSIEDKQGAVNSEALALLLSSLSAGR